jgi:hypothetical protein
MSINLEGFVRRKTTIRLGGKDWVFTELSLSDLAHFRAEIADKRKIGLAEKRKQLIEEAKGLGNIDPLKLLEHLDKPITDEDMDNEMESIEGVGFLAYLSLKYHYPEATKEDALKIVSIEKIEEICNAMMGGLADDKKKPKAKAKKD